MPFSGAGAEGSKGTVWMVRCSPGTGYSVGTLEKQRALFWEDMLYVLCLCLRVGVGNLRVELGTADTV